MSKLIQKKTPGVCRGTITPVGGLKPRTKLHGRASAATVAVALRLLSDGIDARSEHTHLPNNSAMTHALGLARITLHLTMTELNNVPGGLHINQDDTITVPQLTEEQRTVLLNHRGIIREALRQIKAAKVEEESPVPE